MNQRLTAITVHQIPGKEFCGVVVLEQQPDSSCTGTCRKCAKPFQRISDQAFERQVLAVRN